jgi:hypothetical protein
MVASFGLHVRHCQQIYSHLSCTSVCAGMCMQIDALRFHHVHRAPSVAKAQPPQSSVAHSKAKPLEYTYVLQSKKGQCCASNWDSIWIGFMGLIKLRSSLGMAVPKLSEVYSTRNVDDEVLLPRTLLYPLSVSTDSLLPCLQELADGHNDANLQFLPFPLLWSPACSAGAAASLGMARRFAVSFSQQAIRSTEDDGPPAVQECSGFHTCCDPLANPPPPSVLFFALNLPCTLASAADALLGMVNFDLLLLLLSHG